MAFCIDIGTKNKPASLLALPRYVYYVLAPQKVHSKQDKLPGAEFNTCWNTFPWFTVNSLTHLHC